MYICRFGIAPPGDHRGVPGRDAGRPRGHRDVRIPEPQAQVAPGSSQVAPHAHRGDGRLQPTQVRGTWPGRPAVHIHVCMYIYIYICIHCMYVYIYICICIHIIICIYRACRSLLPNLNLSVRYDYSSILSILESVTLSRDPVGKPKRRVPSSELHK